MTGPGSWFVESPPAEPAESSASFDRLYRAFLTARAALGLALVVAQLIAASLKTLMHSTLVLSASYAMAALALWLLPQLRRGASAGAGTTFRRRAGRSGSRR